MTEDGRGVQWCQSSLVTGRSWPEGRRPGGSGRVWAPCRAEGIPELTDTMPWPPGRLERGDQCWSTLSGSPRAGPGRGSRPERADMPGTGDPPRGVLSGLTPQPEAAVSSTPWEIGDEAHSPWTSNLGLRPAAAGAPASPSAGRGDVPCDPYSHVGAHLLPVSSSRGA